MTAEEICAKVDGTLAVPVAGAAAAGVYVGDLLSDAYDICYASDGIEAMKALRSHKDEIDLLILDLYS